MSSFKSLFGGGKTTQADAPAAPLRSEDYDGYLVEAAPYSAEGQFQIAGTISRTTDGERREHRFVRADRCVAIGDAAEMSIRKGRHHRREGAVRAD